MDQAARIEEKVDRLVRESVPREEVDRRFDRVDAKLDRVLLVLDAQGTRVGVVEAKVAKHEEYDRRLSQVEDVAAVHRRGEQRSGWLWPTLVTIGATILNGLLTLLTYLGTGGSTHHG